MCTILAWKTKIYPSETKILASWGGILVFQARINQNNSARFCRGVGTYRIFTYFHTPTHKCVFGVGFDSHVLGKDNLRAARRAEKNLDVLTCF